MTSRLSWASVSPAPSAARSASAAFEGLMRIDGSPPSPPVPGLLILAELAPAGPLGLLAAEIAAVGRLAVARRSLEMEEAAALELRPDDRVLGAMLLRL